LEGRGIDEVSAPSGGTGSWTGQEIYAGSRHLATFTSGTGGQAYWDFSDWLGTERARVNAVTGGVAETCASLPWGDNLQCTGTDESPLHFTGKQRDTESGLDDFGARYNSSSLGRFLSADPENAGADSTNPQSWDMYSYVVNNPLVLVDPTGLDCLYFNDNGNGIEAIDHNSDGNECSENGGDWVNGWTTAGQVSYDASSDTFSVNSSDVNNSYNTLVSAPGSQTSGRDCYGDCTYSYARTSMFSGNPSPFGAFLKSFFSPSQLLSTTYRSFAGQDGCDRLMFNTLAEDLLPISGAGPGLGDVANSAQGAAYGAGLVRAGAYSAAQGLSTPMRSSIYRSLRGGAAELGETVAEYAPGALVAGAAGHALWNAASAANNGTCH
ncbi:MAG: RHS repeat-associated core domain-containing protein, partial [Gammaproteobacteria bacterium]